MTEPAESPETAPEAPLPSLKHEFFDAAKLKRRPDLVQKAKSRTPRARAEAKEPPAPPPEPEKPAAAEVRDEKGRFKPAEGESAPAETTESTEAEPVEVAPEESQADPKEDEAKKLRERMGSRAARLLSYFEDDPKLLETVKRELESPKSALDAIIRARRDEQKAVRQLRTAEAKEKQLTERDQAISARERAVNDLGDLAEVRRMKEIAELKRTDPFAAARALGLSFRDLAEHANSLGDDGRPKPPDPVQTRLEEIERAAAERVAKLEKALAEKEEAEKKERDEREKQYQSAERERHELAFVGKVIDENIEDLTYVDAEPEYEDRAHLARSVRAAIYYHLEQTGEELSPRQVLQRLDRALEERENARQQRLSAKRRDAPTRGAERGNGAVKPAKPVGDSPSSLSTADASQKTGETAMSRKDRRSQALKRFAGG